MEKDSGTMLVFEHKRHLFSQLTSPDVEWKLRSWVKWLGGPSGSAGPTQHGAALLGYGGADPGVFALRIFTDFNEWVRRCLPHSIKCSVTRPWHSLVGTSWNGWPVAELLHSSNSNLVSGGGRLMLDTKLQHGFSHPPPKKRNKEMV